MLSIRELFPDDRIGNEQDLIYDMKERRVVSGRRKRDPQLDYVKCHHGHIGVWGHDELYASLDSDFHLRGRLAGLGRVVQDGTDGLTVVFPPGGLKAVCQIMEPRRQYRKAG
jgi:hypothetical protein